MKRFLLGTLLCYRAKKATKKETGPAWAKPAGKEK